MSRDKEERFATDPLERARAGNRRAEDRPPTDSQLRETRRKDFQCMYCGESFYQHIGLLHHLDRSARCGAAEYTNEVIKGG